MVTAIHIHKSPFAELTQRALACIVQRCAESDAETLGFSKLTISYSATSDGYPMLLVGVTSTGEEPEARTAFITVKHSSVVTGKHSSDRAMSYTLDAGFTVRTLAADDQPPPTDRSDRNAHHSITRIESEMRAMGESLAHTLLSFFESGSVSETTLF